MDRNYMNNLINSLGLDENTVVPENVMPQIEGLLNQFPEFVKQKNELYVTLDNNYNDFISGRLSWDEYSSNPRNVEYYRDEMRNEEIKNLLQNSQPSSNAPVDFNSLTPEEQNYLLNYTNQQQKKLREKMNPQTPIIDPIMQIIDQLRMQR